MRMKKPCGGEEVGLLSAKASPERGRATAEGGWKRSCTCGFVKSREIFRCVCMSVLECIISVCSGFYVYLDTKGK